jgi:hypothetical protein
MDVFPGVMFEPGSLHKYLYCEGNAINYIDPNGHERTYLSMISAVGIAAVLISIVYTNAFHLLSTLTEYSKPIEWSGNMIYISYSSDVFGWGLGIILTGLTGKQEGKPSRSESFIILMAGIAIAPFSYWPYEIFKINWSIPLGGIKIETPGLIGLKPISLCGPVSWLSASFVLGIGKSATNFYMGMGKSYFPKPKWLVGIDVGTEAMGGLSFPCSVFSNY